MRGLLFWSIFYLTTTLAISQAHSFQYQFTQGNIWAVQETKQDTFRALAAYWTGNENNAFLLRAHANGKISLAPILPSSLWKTLRLDPKSKDLKTRLNSGPNCFGSVIRYHNSSSPHRFYSKEELNTYLKTHFEKITIPVLTDVQLARKVQWRHAQKKLLPGDVIVLYGSWITTTKAYDRKHGKVTITNSHYGPVHAMTYLSSGYIYNKNGTMNWQRYKILTLLDVIKKWNYTEVKLYRPKWRWQGRK